MQSHCTHCTDRASRGSLGLEMGMHVRQHNLVKGGVFYIELVTRVTRLGYEIRPKIAKRRCSFQK
jgi:hypothetical protein